MMLFKYRRIIAMELFSDLGNQCVQLSLMSLIFFDTEGTTVDLLALCLIQQGPSVFFSAAVGKWIGRKGPRVAIMAATIGKGLLALALTVPVGAGAELVIYLLFMLGSTLFMVSRLAITPQLIPEERFIDYKAVNQRVALAGGILGPWLVGLSIRHAGEEMAVAIGTCMFLLSGLFASRLPEIETNDTRRAPSCKNTGRFRALRNRFFPDCHVRVKHPMVWTGVLLAGGGLLNFGGPHFNNTYLSGDIAVWSMVISCYQAGAWIAALLFRRFSRKGKEQRMIIGNFLLLGFCFALPAVIQQRYLFMGSMTGLGFGFTLLYEFLEFRIQKTCPAANLPTTMAALAACRSICLLAGIAAGFVLTRIFPETAWLMGSGAAMFFGGAWVAMRFPNRGQSPDHV